MENQRSQFVVSRMLHWIMAAMVVTMLLKRIGGLYEKAVRLGELCGSRWPSRYRPESCLVDSRSKGFDAAARGEQSSVGCGSINHQGS